MDYFSKKELMKEKAISHLTHVCKEYAEEISESVDLTDLYTEDDCIELLKKNGDRDSTGNVCVSFDKIDVVEGVFKHAKKKKKIAVLNFASFKHPGGMFLKGSTAQEECICHSSTLYPVISAFDDTYYYYNRSNKNKGLYKNRMLYTPDIVFMNDSGKTKIADVITMAAPNRGVALKNGVSETEIEYTMRERIKCILEVAEEHDVELLILGAYGCGVFKNNASVVASIFHEEFKRYKNMEYFFPIPDEEHYNQISSEFIHAMCDFVY